MAISDGTYEYRRGGPLGWEVNLNGVWTGLNPAVSDYGWLESQDPEGWRADPTAGVASNGYGEAQGNYTGLTPAQEADAKARGYWNANQYYTWGPGSSSYASLGGVDPNEPNGGYKAYTDRGQAAGQAEAARQDAASGGGLFGNPILDAIGQAAAAYFGGPIGAGLYGTVASGGDIGKGLLAAGMTYAGGQLTGTGSGATGGSWYSPSGDIGNIFSGSGVRTIADVGTGVGSINPSLTESFNSMYSPSAWASTAGAAAGSVAPAGWTQSAWDGLMSGNYSAVTGANAGSGAMDWTDVLGEWPSYGDAASGGYGPGGNLTLDQFLTSPDSITGLEGFGGSQGIPGMDTLGSTSWLESAYNTLKANGLSPTDALRAAKAVMGGDSSGAGLLSGALSGIGGLLAGKAAQGAANTTANAQLEAARIAAEAAKFKPIGITTRFGQSNFQKDAQGNVIGAGYALTPDMKAQQDALMAQSGQMLTQYQNAPGMFAPMGVAGQRAMSLGNQYLATDPAAQAQKYMNDQQALLATGRERDMNQMLTGEFNRGTYGLATGGTSTGMGAANPRLEAMLNAQRQQDLGLAAQATQGGMDYAKFGAGMVGTGGDLTKGMFSGQTAAYQPYQTALQGAQYIEGLGQQPLTMGIDIGKQTSNAASGGLLAQGMVNAAQTQQNAAYSPWGTLLMGAGNQVQNYQNQQQQQQQQAQQQALMASLWGK